MQKAKKICCQITPRRIIGAILLAATAGNLLIVGAAFDTAFAVPAVTETQTSHPSPFWTPTRAVENTPLVTLTVETASQTPTFTSTNTLTDTTTSTFTDTPSPSPTACVPMYSWPAYVVQAGDWLQAIARKTASSVPELVRANCLLDTVIYPGQVLRVPQLPTSTPSITPTPWTNAPTNFRSPSVCVLEDGFTLSFAVMAYDPEGISSLIVSYNISGYEIQNKLSMQLNGDFYRGEGAPEGQESVGTIYYTFIATDAQGVDTPFVADPVQLGSCQQGQKGT